VAQLPDLKMLMVDNNQLVGELDVCNVSLLVADCGDPDQGCPNCESMTMEVDCPCCTSCCYDGDEACNLDNWLTEIEHEWRHNYDRDFYGFEADERFEPAD
jgi:hypothetical protein